MTNNARNHSKIRSNRKRRNDSCDKNIYELFVNVIKEQNGRCIITGIPFAYERNHKFSPSPDRLDNTKGYVDDNVRMIITPLNTQNNNF